MIEFLHHRHHDFEPYDRITIDVVPRFKQSGLSGDEWRTSVRVVFFFKGEAVHEAHFSDVTTALAMLPAEHIHQCVPIKERVIELEQRERRCDQPGCSAPSSVAYRVRRFFSRGGELLDAKDMALDVQKIVWFCDEHAERGDADREDSDSNLERVKFPPAPQPKKSLRRSRRDNRGSKK